jgi:curli biogenesis system outer membrane secretion channel CsgG
MKRVQAVLAVCILLGLTLGIVPQVMAAGGGLRYSIAVSKFENRSNWIGRYDIGDAWGAVLTDSLNQSGQFIVLGEKDMRREALEEQDFAASGRAAGGGKTVPTGQMATAQLLVKGAITHFADGTAGGGGGISIKGFRIGAKGSKAEINTLVYVIDSTTGIVVASKKCYGELSKSGLSLGLTSGDFGGDVAGFRKTNAGKAVEKAVDEAVAFIVSVLDEIPWTGKVIRVKGKKVFINRGTREGVVKGQVFDVGQADILRDPDTGEILDQSMEKLATIEVVKVKKKISICKINQGSGVEKGMTVVFSE